NLRFPFRSPLSQRRTSYPPTDRCSSSRAHSEPTSGSTRPFVPRSSSMEKRMSEARFEAWIDDSPNAPAALVLREFLVPVEGRDGVFFPPTFAASENTREFPGGYNINDLGQGENVCLIDS